MAAGARAAANWLAHGEHGLAVLRTKIMAGQLGRKSGKGFYSYPR